MSIEHFISFAQDLVLPAERSAGAQDLPRLADVDESGVWCALAVLKVRPELTEPYLEAVIPGDTSNWDGLHRLMVRIAQEAADCLPRVLQAPVVARLGLEGFMVGVAARALLLQGQTGSQQALDTMETLMGRFGAATRHDLNGNGEPTTLIHLVAKHIHSQAMLMRYSREQNFDELHDWGLDMVRRALNHGAQLEGMKIKRPDGHARVIEAPLLMAVRHYTNAQVRPVAIEVLLEAGACPKTILDHNLGTAAAREILARHPRHVRAQLESQVERPRAGIRTPPKL